MIVQRLWGEHLTIAETYWLFQNTVVIISGKTERGSAMRCLEIKCRPTCGNSLLGAAKDGAAVNAWKTLRRPKLIVGVIGLQETGTVLSLFSGSVLPYSLI
jgi:hypothetical protein